MIEPDSSLDLLHRLCSRFIQDLHRRIHNFHKTLNSRHTPLELLCKLNDSADSGKQSCHIHGVGYQITGADQALYHKNTSGKDHHRVHQSVKHTDSILERSHIFVGFSLNIQEGLVVLPEFFNFDILVCKSTDNSVSQKIILNFCIQLTNLISLALKSSPHLQIKIGAGYCHNRNKCKNNHGQRQIDPCQHSKGHNRLDSCDKKFLRTMMGKFRDIKQITGDPGHNLPHLRIIKITV